MTLPRLKYQLNKTLTTFSYVNQLGVITCYRNWSAFAQIEWPVAPLLQIVTIPEPVLLHRLPSALLSVTTGKQTFL
jgi:hypothetical protein